MQSDLLTAILRFGRGRVVDPKPDGDYQERKCYARQAFGYAHHSYSPGSCTNPARDPGYQPPDQMVLPVDVAKQLYLDDTVALVDTAPYDYGLIWDVRSYKPWQPELNAGYIPEIEFGRVWLRFKLMRSAQVFVLLPTHAGDEFLCQYEDIAGAGVLGTLLGNYTLHLVAPDEVSREFGLKPQPAEPPQKPRGAAIART